MRTVSVIFLLSVTVSSLIGRYTHADDTSIILSISMGPLNGSEQAHGLPVEMTLSDLQALPASTIETTTLWTPGQQVFSGVWLATLLDHHGIESGTLELVAVNDYRVKIPVRDIHPGGALLAYERNGQVMSLRNKGPLWLVYDWDGNPDFRSETYYARSIWQLDRIVVTR